jgi:micrococcal nuclease
MDIHNIGSAEGEDMPQEEKQNKNPFELVKVVKVIDGDTFIASDGRRVRLIGVDAPESY